MQELTPEVTKDMTLYAADAGARGPISMSATAKGKEKSIKAVPAGCVSTENRGKTPANTCVSSFKHP